MTLSCNKDTGGPREASRQDAQRLFQLLTSIIAFLTLLSPGYICSHSCSAGLDGGRKASSGSAHYPTLGHGNRCLSSRHQQRCRQSLCSQTWRGKCTAQIHENTCLSVTPAGDNTSQNLCQFSFNSSLAQKHNKPKH